MKQTGIIILSVLTLGLLASCNNSSKTNVNLITPLDSVSYAIGVNMGGSFSTQLPKINIPAFNKGLLDAMDTSITTLIDKKDLQMIIQSFFQKKQQEDLAAKQKEMESQYKGKKEEGIKFLEENKQREGVMTTESGLQYEVIKKGSGKTPSADATVEVHYHGTTPEGVVFDSSVDRGKTETFPLGRVIPGWTEGLQLMRKGAKYKFYIPQELAYGANPPQGGQGPIKPYMPLVFEVELINIK